MSELSKAGRPADLPMIGTICGSHGSGKTTLAASFPNPIFIQAEKGGLTSIPINIRPDAMEPIDGDSKKLFAQINELANEAHEYKTVVIDTVSALEDVFSVDVMNMPDNKLNSKVTSITTACGGFGGGMRAVADIHHRLMKAAEYLCEFRGMHVLFLAHSDTKTIDPPDQESYTQFSLQMNKYSVAVYSNYSHIVAQCAYEAYVVPNDNKKKAGKAKTTNNRIVRCCGELASVNKNRYVIDQDIPFILGENPFAFLSIFNTQLGNF